MTCNISMICESFHNLAWHGILRPESPLLVGHLKMVPASLMLTCGNCTQAWTGEESIGDALLSTLQRLPHAKWVATTLGSRGSVFLQRADQLGGGQPKGGQPQNIDKVLGELWERAESSGSSSSAELACTTPDGVQIRWRTAHCGSFWFPPYESTLCLLQF